MNAKENGSHVIINKSPEGITIENTTENNGVKEPQKFKAANAEGLKKNHPEAYKLLQKYTENIQTDNGNGHSSSRSIQRIIKALPRGIS